MIVDCVLFNDEIDILNLRISYLKPTIDLFVIFESDFNFSGGTKELLARKSLSKENSDANCIFIKYEYPIHLLEQAKSGNRWPIERYARDSIADFITGSAATDTILVSDVDEIPSKSQVLVGRDLQLGKLRTPLYYRRANWSVPHGSEWSTVLIGKPKNLKNLNELRYKKCVTIRQDPGCHLSYLSAYDNTKSLFLKMSTSAHSELSQDEKLIARRINFADKYVIDHLGRFDRKGHGLIDVKGLTELNDIQLLLLRTNPELFDFASVPFRKSTRIYASYALTRDWMKKGDLNSIEKLPKWLHLKLISFLSERLLRLLFHKLKRVFRELRKDRL